MFFQSLEVDFLSCVQDVQPALLEDVSYFVRSPPGSDELSRPAFWNYVAKYPYRVADAVCSCLDVAVEFLFLSELGLVCVSSHQLVDFLLSCE